MARRSRGGPREKERDGRRANDPRVCESMPGFNDQQRERGCILAMVERGERSAETAEEEEVEEKGRRQANNAGRKKKARGARTAPGDLLEASRGSEDSAGTTHGVRYWRTLSHY